MDCGARYLFFCIVILLKMSKVSHFKMSKDWIVAPGLYFFAFRSCFKMSKVPHFKMSQAWTVHQVFVFLRSDLV